MSEENMNFVEEKKPAAKKQGAPTGVIILLLILFFPVGLLLMWLKKSWKLWVKIGISLLFLFVIIAVVSNGNTNTANPSGTASSDVAASTDESQTDTTKSTENEITYEKVDLQKMIDDLKENALRAENTYQNKYVEVTGNIENLDSDGAYISIAPAGDEWNLTTVMCYIKTSEQKDYLLNKNIGDPVTIKGKIKSIGEVLGYSINIDEIK